MGEAGLNLGEMSYQELRKLCFQYGVEDKGKKADLIARLEPLCGAPPVETVAAPESGKNPEIEAIDKQLEATTSVSPDIEPEKDEREQVRVRLGGKTFDAAVVRTEETPRGDVNYLVQIHATGEIKSVAEKLVV